MLFSDRCGSPGLGTPSLTQARHRQHLEDCLSSLNTFLGGPAAGAPAHKAVLHFVYAPTLLHVHAGLCDREEQLVFAAEELRQALRSLGHITGHVAVTDILDVIFKDFCIGK